MHGIPLHSMMDWRTKLKPWGATVSFTLDPQVTKGDTGESTSGRLVILHVHPVQFAEGA